MQRPSERVAPSSMSTPAPRRESPTVRAEEARLFTPRPVLPVAVSGLAERAPVSRLPAPISVTKSPDDLKAILRSMTAKGSAEREQKLSQNKQSLNGALAEVLGKGERNAEGGRQEVQKSVAVKPPQPPQEEKKPFEIPESELRKVLKGES